MTSKKPLKRQIFWAKFLLELKFVIFYTLNKENRKANLLTY